MKKFLIVFALCLLIVPLGAHAQRLDPDAEPNFGTLFLDASFPVDPYIRPMISGGPVDASLAALGANCRGYIAEEPDWNLDWSGAADRLRFFFVSSGDTTLVIRDPNGMYHCDDDSGITLNALVEFNRPLEGMYNVWVGSYGRNEFISGYLMLTQSTLDIADVLASVATGGLISDGTAREPDPSSGATGGGQQQGSGSAGGAVALNPGGVPIAGEVDLAPAFMPDPLTTQVQAGGTVDAFPLGLGNECRGFVTAEPTYVVNAASGLLALTIYAVSTGDTTLIVQQPDGSYVCNDDYSGRNPGVSISRPQAGAYAIWVGTFSRGGENVALSISEVPSLSPSLFQN